MRGFLKDFDPEVRDMADTVVTASIATYQFMAAAFLPTPSKAHYLFNMRFATFLKESLITKFICIFNTNNKSACNICKKLHS